MAASVCHCRCRSRMPKWPHPPPSSRCTAPSSCFCCRRRRRADVELGSDDDAGELLSGVVDCCVGIHQSVERASRKFYSELRR